MIPLAKKTIGTKAVVIREVTVGEADKLLTLLTPELGRITARCRGVRSLKSRRFAAAQLYMYSDMILSEKDGLYTLEEADTIESFFGIRESLASIACANYFSELLNHVTVEGEGDADMMRLFLNCLYALANKKEIAVTKVKAVFEARLVALLGIQPDLSACATCGKPFEKGWLDVSDGVLLCADCLLDGGNQHEDGFAEGERLLLPMSGEVVRLITYLAECDLKRLFAFSASDGLLEELARTVERYLGYHIGKKLDTLVFYHSII